MIMRGGGQEEEGPTAPITTIVINDPQPSYVVCDPYRCGYIQLKGQRNSANRGYSAALLETVE